MSSKNYRIAINILGALTILEILFIGRIDIKVTGLTWIMVALLNINLKL